MVVFIIRRTLMMIPVLLGATILCFVLVDVSNDPVQDRVFEIEQSTGEPVPQTTIDALEASWYYDRSVPERYWIWLTGFGDTNDDIGLIQGLWGPSIEGTAMPIGDEISSRFWITLRLVLFATIASIGIAILAGVVSAVKQYSRTDYTLTFLGFLFLAMPIFWLGSLFKEGAVQLNKILGSTIFQTYGSGTTGFQGNGWQVFTDSLPFLIVPTLVLMLGGYAAISRYQRASMLEVMNSDYVRLARAKGVRNATVMRRHALRTALVPVATFAPLALSGAMGGAMVTESIFGWRGLGVYSLDAINAGDTFAVMAYVLISGIVVLIGVLISDILYGVLDPRIRFE
ncbi:ABC transporter permease [Glycomyces harbinensis]|uniref:Peptide/nickel transport system permease protein n=1 Tax=Glycomyces harbinensis TaxID=58114 RepID=A0A1G6Z8S0_9ACTN|nr:ABC transporter permease [Glycomyces harbinensis]SDD98990.1 peptide/nickel transport system permease protein [Glycomyces harbinensis]